MKKILITIAALVGFGFASAYADANIAVVNFQKLLQNSPKVSAVKTELDKKFADDQNKLKDQQQKLKELMDKMHREGSVMKDADKTALQNQIDQLQKDYMDKAQSYQQAIGKAQQEAMRKVFDDVNTVIAGLAKKNHYDFVLPTDMVAYADTKFDITDAVTKAYNDSK